MVWGLTLPKHGPQFKQKHTRLCCAPQQLMKLWIRWMMNPLKVLQEVSICRQPVGDSHSNVHGINWVEKVEIPFASRAHWSCNPCSARITLRVGATRVTRNNPLIYCIFVARSAIQCAGKKLFWMSKWWASDQLSTGVEAFKDCSSSMGLKKSNVKLSISQSKRSDSQASVPLLFWLLTTAAECGNALEAIHGLRLRWREGREGISACENLKIGSFDQIRSLQLSDLFRLSFESIKIEDWVDWVIELRSVLSLADVISKFWGVQFKSNIRSKDSGVELQILDHKGKSEILQG